MRSMHAMNERYSAASRSCLRIWFKEICYVFIIILFISRYLLKSLKCSLKSLVFILIYWNNNIYLNTDISLLLIKAAACIIANGKYISISSSSLTAISLLSNAYFVIRRASSCLALALLILFSFKILLYVKSSAAFLL
jgi:hypothetical protein